MIILPAYSLIDQQSLDISRILSQGGTGFASYAPSMDEKFSDRQRDQIDEAFWRILEVQRIRKEQGMLGGDRLLEAQRRGIALATRFEQVMLEG